ncbi:cysteine proteinase [Aspergillus ellipticus CBS 707.79]|uniref:Cysteine proteinase n=1 Tax=Aspergillus ellipticus CBS 707.79 TaxID=1448320 RepID=A0A319DPS2_9EURO|nr:cysteine proteinase [Aspergillus ellipticus CBS 707.79]
MPFFGKLSEYLPPWSPPQPAAPAHDTAHSPPPSDAISDQIPRTETSGADSPVESGFSHRPPSESLPQSTPASSNAEGLRHFREPRPVRPKYRQTVPRSESGMRRLSGEKSIHTAQHQSTERDDELRLFPPNKRWVYRKPNRVNNTQAGTTPGHTGLERSKKRRRQEYSETSAGNPINLSDNDVEEQPAREAHAVAEHSSRMSPTLSQISRKRKKQRDNRIEVKEFRAVEELMKSSAVHISPKHAAKAYSKLSSDDEHDERFTENAAKERRRTSLLPGPDYSSIKSDRPGKAEIFQSVEIVNPKPSGSAKHVKNNRTNSKQAIQKGAGRRVTDSRESPDELQGAVTVQIPSFSGVPRRRARSESELEEHPATGNHQLSSPDIRPTVFQTSENGLKGKRKKSVKTPKLLSTQSFKVTFVRSGSIEQQASDGKPVQLDVDTTKGTIVFTHKLDSKSVDVPFSKILKVFRGESPSHKVRLKLSKMSEFDQQIDIELISVQVKEAFCAFLATQRLQIVDKEGEWLDKAFKKAQRELKQLPNGTKRPSSESVPEPVPGKQPDSAKRVKLTDGLRNENGVASSATASRDRANPSVSAAKPNETSPPENSPSRPSKRPAEPSVEVAVKKSTLLSDRATTRTMSRRPPTTTTVVCDDSDGDLAQPPLPDGNTERWHKPLVYPLFGKKKAEVDVYDLDRLRENEFLNDNLIGFYIRFLQEHLDRTNQEVAKKVYFYNSFFYDALMNTPRGKRGINYEGVQKWTRTVDIFSHDYVVVPINESAHWYVAIICNLPNLRGIASETSALGEPVKPETELSVPPDSQVQEVPETPEPEIASIASNKRKAEKTYSDSGKEELARQSLASMSLAEETKKEGREDISTANEESEGKEMPVVPPKTLSDIIDAARDSESTAKPRKVKTKRAGPKYDACQPIIITFDSLDASRSPTIRYLREYLYEEAKSKRGIKIDTSLIKGMTARGIPLQPNYSDCGLYLLAYLEKFVQDPDLFIKKLLQKEMDSNNDWPPLKSGLLRHRLGKFLDDLYDEQELLKRKEVSEKDTMADTTPICYLLGTSVSAAETKREKKKAPQRKGKDSPKSTKPVENDSQNPKSDSGADANSGADSTEEKFKTPREPSPAVDVKRSPSASSESDDARQSVEPDIVLVPDSQPQATSSSAIEKAPKSRPSKRTPGVEVPPPIAIDEDTVTAVPVETQVRGTPPPSAPVRGSVENSPAVPKT